MVQLNLTGGEPLVRSDLEAIVSAGRQNQMYINLITSGVPLTKERLVALKDAGIDAVQLSLQDATPELSRRVAGVDRFAAKLDAAQWIGELGLPLTLNVVLHRDNLDRVADFVGWAERLGAERLDSRTAIPRVGSCESRSSVAVASSARARPRRCRRSSRAPPRQDGSALRAPGLLLRSPQGVHGRLGAALHRGGARWALFCRATKRTPLPGSSIFPMHAIARSGSRGTSQRPSSAFGARVGCRIRAVPAIGESVISAGAGARHFISPATQPRPIPRDLSPITASSRRRARTWIASQPRLTGTERCASCSDLGHRARYVPRLGEQFGASCERRASPLLRYCHPPGATTQRPSGSLLDNGSSVRVAHADRSDGGCVSLEPPRVHPRAGRRALSRRAGPSQAVQSGSGTIRSFPAPTGRSSPLSSQFRKAQGASPAGRRPWHRARIARVRCRASALRGISSMP